MNVLLKKIRALFQSSALPPEHSGEIDELIRGAMEPLRVVDPRTRVQWARLNQRIVSGAERTSSRRPQLRLIVAGASAVVAAGLIFLLWRSDSHPTFYSTGAGERSTIVLPDSSEVTLSHTTSVTVAEFRAGAPRRLELAGEAFFRIHRNETPFIVSNGGVEVQVLGTAFNVRNRHGSVSVAVKHGIVRVIAKDSENAEVVLTAGQRALASASRGCERLDDIPTDDLPDWMNGRLLLTQTTLEEACREVALRFGVRVEVRGASDLQITGLLEAPSAEASLRALATLTGKHVSREGATYILQ